MASDSGRRHRWLRTVNIDNIVSVLYYPCRKLDRRGWHEHDKAAVFIEHLGIKCACACTYNLAKQSWSQASSIAVENTYAVNRLTYSMQVVGWLADRCSVFVLTTMARSIEQRGHHVTYALIGTSRQWAAHNYTSSLALSVRAGGCKRRYQNGQSRTCYQECGCHLLHSW